MPAEPPPGRWAFPPVEGADDDGLVGVGADLEPGTLLSAYRHGVFPMPVGRGRHLGWWSPDPRAILPLDELRISRSLRRSLHRYEIRVDTAFDRVVEACADPRRAHGWISPEIRVAYGRLHELGWAHSIEAWVDDGGGCPTLAGGLYGVAIGGLFAGESMFHRRTDASKATLVALVEHLTAAGAQGRLLDVQWQTAHLASLGVVEIPRREYLRRLSVALEHPLPPVFGL